jgi:hypothetical protein
MKVHAKHLLMCAPMILVVAVLLATGSSLAVLIPAVGCMVMMGAMMALMWGVARHDQR